jgi:hypothetical protein
MAGHPIRSGSSANAVGHARDWRGRGAALWTVVLVSGCLLAGFGCATRSSDGTVRRHYFPYAVVTTPPVAPDGPRITVREVRSFGLVFGNGSTVLGHGKEHHVVLPPDGRMYLVVQTDEQFQKAKELIEKHPELGLYATKNPNP